MKKERELWIDILKGLAIIFVVMGHVVSSYRNSNMLMDAVAFNFIYEFVYAFHMPLFFVVSGYLAGKSKKEEPLATSILQKCISLGVPYVVFSIVLFCLKFLAKSLVNSQLSLKNLLMIWIYPISFLWFLYALLLISLISLFLKRLGMNKRPLVILAGSLICKMVVAFILNTDLLQSEEISSSIFFDVFKFYFWYVLGEYLAGLLSDERRQELLSIKNGFVIIFLFLFAVAVYLSSFHYEIQSVFVEFLFECCGIGIFVLIAMKISTSKLLELIGKQTLPIYLLHGYVISFVRVVLNKLHIPMVHGLVPMLLGTVLGVAIPLLIYELSTKIKGLDFVFYPQRYIKLKRK